MWPNGKAFDWNSKDSGFDPQHGHEANNSKFLFFFFLVWGPPIPLLKISREFKEQRNVCEAPTTPARYIFPPEPE